VFVTRFAPSPTGYLHRGHAFSALTAHAAARAADGRFILRIEDIDTTRSRPQFEAAILEDLAWLGLGWETPVRRQSEHMADYQAALDGLIARGLVYRCFRTRKELAQEITRAPHGSPDSWRGAPDDDETARLAAGEAFAWRLSMDAVEMAGLPRLSFAEEGGEVAGADVGGPIVIAFDTSFVGDIVLARKDVGVAYHLAVVVDDALQGVTHVIRGRDLFEATYVQRVLQHLLGLPTPVYRHHRLLTGADGRRFAKRDRSETLRELRAQGMTAAQLREELGFG
jgi:glutamyl-Q tRNA(Asp) synthetase